jgi:hypothetical protein
VTTKKRSPALPDVAGDSPPSTECLEGEERKNFGPTSPRTDDESLDEGSLIDETEEQDTDVTEIIGNDIDIEKGT